MFAVRDLLSLRIRGRRGRMIVSDPPMNVFMAADEMFVLTRLWLIMKRASTVNLSA